MKKRGMLWLWLTPALPLLYLFWFHPPLPGMESPQSSFHLLSTALQHKDMATLDRLTTQPGKDALFKICNHNFENTALYATLKAQHKLDLDTACQPLDVWQKWLTSLNETQITWTPWDGDPNVMMMNSPYNGVNMLFVSTRQGWKLDRVITVQVK